MKAHSFSRVSPCLFVLAILLPLIACEQAKQMAVAGTYVSERNPEHTRELRPDGIFIYMKGSDGVEGRYELSGNEITFRVQALGTTRIVKSKLDGDAIVDRDGERFVKQVAGASLGHESARATSGAEDATREAETMRIIRDTGTAMMAWLTDQLGGSAADAFVPPPSGVASCSAVKRMLHPTADFYYMKTVYCEDAWGHPFEFRVNEVHARSVMGIRSAGRNGRFEAASVASGPFSPTSDADDIVWSDGVFTRWPAQSEGAK